jgi:DNA-binding transcriptional ArsR family regulator
VLNDTAGHKASKRMRQFVAITKALSCEKRLRILMALRNGELCEGVINELVDLSPATTSRHLWLLRQAGLVDSEKTGRCVCYRLAKASPSAVPGKTLRWLRDCLATHPQILADAKEAQALSGCSTVQAECCERRERLARKWSQKQA